MDARRKSPFTRESGEVQSEFHRATAVQTLKSSSENTGKPVPWSELAAAFEVRGKNDCRKRWAKMDQKWKKGAWDGSEDERLLCAVAKHGSW